MRTGIATAGVLSLLLAASAAPAAPNRGIPHFPGDRDTTSILPAGDVDTFAFDLPRGAALSVTVKAARGVTLLPALVLLRPDGSTVSPAEMAAAKYAPGKSSARVVKLPVDQTGRWAARVSGTSGTQTGAYTFQTKVAKPKPFVARGVVLPAGGTLDVPVPLANSSRLTFVLKRKSGGTGFTAPTVRQPAGTALPFPAAAWTLTEKGVSAKNLEVATPALGEHVVRVPGPATGGDAIVDWTAKVAWPKRKPGGRAISPDEPAITSVNPSQGNFGTQVQVAGSKFADGAVLEVGTAPATSVVRNGAGTLLTGIVPVGTGTVPVTVINPDGQETTKDAAFTYVPPPTVTSVVPNHGPATGGTPVTVKGTNFRTGARVYFGTTAVVGTVTVVDATTLTLTTEARPSGIYTVEVRDLQGQSGQLVGGFVFDRLMTPRAGAFPGSVAASALAAAAVLGDLEGDAAGADDFVVASPTLLPDGGGGYLPAARVLRGNGDLTFTDLTGTSFPGTFFPNIASVPTGTGPPLNPSTPDYGLAGAAAMGDLDGDGDQDLVLAADGRFLPSNGWVLNNPNYPATSAYPFIPSYNLATQYYYLQYPGTRVLKNDGAGHFLNTTMNFNSQTGAIELAMPLLTQGVVWGEFFQARAIALGDMDGDSDRDLVLATGASFQGIQLVFSGGTYTRNLITSPALRVLANDGKGNFRFDSKFGISGWTPPAAGGESFQGAAVALADLDGNNLRDVVVVDAAAPLDGSSLPLFATRVLMNTGTALVPAPSALPAASGLDDGRGGALVVADVTGDGKADILVATTDPLEVFDGTTGAVTRKSSTRIFRNGGTGTFTDATAAALPAATAAERWRASGLAVADVDRDLDPDLVLVLDEAIPDGAGGYLPSTRILLNNGAGTFSPAPAGFVPPPDLSVPSFRQGRHVLLADFDGDGDRDAVLASASPVTGIPTPASRAPAVEVLQNR